MNSSGPIPALRGYRLQFLCTLLRVLEGDENETVHPESLEDYCVSVADKVTEIVQVKNYSEPLRLSDLSPRKQEGFVRRSVIQLLNDSKVSLKLLVLGPLGPELHGLQVSGTSETIKRKLTNDYSFSASEAELFIGKLEIVQVQAAGVRRQVKDIITETIAGVDSEVTTDMLLYWMYQLAERQESVTRAGLVRKVGSIGQFINERIGFLTEFGASILPLESSTVESGKKEKDEFQSGIAARYSHIESGLDAIRPEKMKALDKAFAEEKVVIVHGASGQGKSTLAYRYAHERYPRGYAFEISSVAGADRVLNIARGVTALARPFSSPFLLLIDVAPGTSHWVDLCRQLSETNNCQMLVTIRAEDLSRTGGVREYFSATDLNLYFTEVEANELYDALKVHAPIPHFLNFMDAWSQFGGKGPLLEFAFFLRQGKRLRDRLERQLQQIEDKVALEGEYNQLTLLRLVAIAGAHDCRLDLRLLLGAVPLNNAKRTLQYFQDEYLLREAEDRRYLEALHPVRARIMADLLCDPILTPASQAFAFCQPIVIEEDWGNYILQYGYYYGWDDAIMSSTLQLRPHHWRTCKEIHQALIWCGVKNYVVKNSAQIDRLRKDFPLGTDLAVMKLMAPEVDLSSLSLIFKEERYSILEEILKEFTPVESFYDIATEWQRRCHYPKNIDFRISPEIAGLGYILFWNSRLEINRPFQDQLFENLKGLQSEDSIREATADLLLGLHHGPLIAQETANILLPGFLRQLQAYGKVTRIEDDGTNLKLHFFFDKNDQNNQSGEGFHGKTMNLIRLIRKALPFRVSYSTQGYGHNSSLVPLPYDASVKNIAAQHLPWPWLTDAKQIFFNLIKYDVRQPEWSDLILHLIEQNRLITASLQSINMGLQKRIKRGNLKDAFRIVPEFRPDTSFVLPKAAADPWGFLDELKEKNLADLFHAVSLLQLLGPGLLPGIKNIKSFHQSVRIFLDQAYVSLTLKDISKEWNEQVWEEKSDQLRKAGYSRDLIRLSKVNLEEAWKNFPAYKKALSHLADSHLSDFDPEILDDLSNTMASLIITWPYFIDFPTKRNPDVNNTARRKAKRIVQSFEDNLTKQLLSYKGRGGCLDVEVFTSKTTEGDWYVLFYVDDVIQMIGCWEALHSLIKASVGSAQINSFKRIILDKVVRNVWAISVHDDFLIRKQTLRFTLYDVLNREVTDTGITNYAVVTDEMITELSLDKIGDSFPEFAQVERYNELFYTIFHSLEYLEQLSELNTVDSIGGLLLEVELKKTYLSIRENCEEFVGLHEPLVKQVEAGMKPPTNYLPEADFMNKASVILQTLNHLETLFDLMKQDNPGSAVFEEVVSIKERISKLTTSQVEVYFGWLDILMHLKLKGSSETQARA